MSPERWKQIASVLNEALPLHGEERESFLNERCGEDRELRGLIDRYLLTEQDATKAFGSPAFSLLDSPDDLPRGAIVEGRYEVLRKINQGGMGEVYLAQRIDGVTTQEMALKVIRRGKNTEEIARRFQHEREILASLSHRHIARFYDGGTVMDGRPYFVMEFVVGRRIDDYCRGERLRPGPRIELFLKVCNAVSHAHRKGVIHRDLKPGNILVTDRGEPKLVDFGIAKLFAENVSQTATTAEMRQRLHRGPMTPEYASPEQWGGRSASTLSDVYSLGVVLFEILTGRRLFQASSLADLNRAALWEAPDRPSDVVNAEGAGAPSRRWLRLRGAVGEARQILRGDVDAVVLKAIAKAPWQRYKSVEALAEDLGRFLTGLPVAARGNRLFYRFRRLALYHRWTAGLSCAVLLAVSGLGATVFQNRLDARRHLHALVIKERALEVAQFFEDSYRRSRSGGDTIPARRLLDEANHLLDNEGMLPNGERWDLPEDLPAVHAALGQAYLGLGLFKGAEESLRQAADLRHQGNLEIDAGWVIALFHWAQAAEGLAKPRQARRLMAKAEAEAASGRADSPRLAKFLNNESLRRMAAGDLDVAVRLGISSLAMRTRIGASEVEISRGQHNLAFILARAGRASDAETILLEALATREKLEGELSPALARSYSSLAILLHDSESSDDWKASVAHAMRSLRIRKFNNQALSQGWHTLGVSLRLAGNPEGALVCAEAAAREMRLAGIADSEGAGFVQYGLAAALVELERFDEAVQAARRGLELVGKQRDEAHWRVAEGKTLLGRALVGRGDVAAGKAYLESGVRVLEEERSSGRSAREAKRWLDELDQGD